MLKFTVEVFVAEDAVRYYLVHAADRDQALEVALEHVRDLVGGEVEPAAPGYDLIDFDGELFQEAS